MLTVYYDGSCPLCVREIALLRRLAREDRIAFENIADPDAEPSCTVDRQRLMARFHARMPGGEMAVGARAFTEAYGRVPGLGWVAALGRFAPTRTALDGLYSLFLTIRPVLQRAARRFDG